jgi:hypothetical protein
VLNLNPQPSGKRSLRHPQKKVKSAGETPAVRLNPRRQQLPASRQAGLVGEKRLAQDDTINSDASEDIAFQVRPNFKAAEFPMLSQNPGIGRINSTATCVLPIKLGPKVTTLQSTSSSALKFSMRIIC